MKKLPFVFSIIALLAAGCNSSQQSSSKTPVQPPVSQNINQAAKATPTLASTTAPTSTPNSQVYETEFLKVVVPTGWTVKEAVKTTYYCVGQQNCTPTPRIEPNPAAVNITKGNYILYINARVSQASGVEGGRFEEYAGGAPSAEAFITEHPGGPCGTPETSAITANATSTQRTDYYVGPKDKTETCLAPPNGKTVWSVSVVGNGINPFNLPSNEPGFSGANGWVVTMAYNSTAINSFPEKGSSALNEALSEMTAIVNNLTIKLPVAYIPEGSKEIAGMANTYWTSSFAEGAVDGLVISCSDTPGTHSIGQDKVQSSFLMETLGPNTQNNYTSASETSTRVGAIEDILVNSGWSHCNSIASQLSPGGTVDVYQKGNELANIESWSSNNTYFNIDLTFFKLN